MSEQAAASYKPDMQVMTLSEHLPAFSDPNNPTGFTTPDQVAIVTHEWVHYLHNLSTVVGMTTVCTYANIWNSFRWTFEEDGWSHCQNEAVSSIVQDIERQFDYLSVLRSANPSTLPNAAESCYTRAIDHELVKSEASPSYQIDLIKLTLEYRRHAQAEIELHNAVIGAHEIFEYAAFALEERASLKLKTLSRPAKLIPYLLVAKLADLVAPSLDRDLVLKASLASLQHPSPATKLLEILRRVERASQDGADAEREVTMAAAELIEEMKLPTELSLQQTEALFPNSEAMGNSVKHTTANIRQLLERRRQNPFFEIDAIQEFDEVETSFAKLILDFGGPLFIQRRQGDPDQVGVDLMYNFFGNDPDSHAISEGWLWSHAAYRFIGAHINERRLQSTHDAHKIKCPFYTTCVCTFRQSSPEKCASRPWLSVLDGQGTCDFAHAVHITRPPASDLSLRTNLEPGMPHSP